jgi:Glutaredoxin-like domain (DUF836)
VAGADACTLVLLGKPDCHLCHEMRDTVLPVLASLGLELVERDVRDDPDLSRRYILAIPVLLFGTDEIARHRVTTDELRARLRELRLA